MVGQWLPNLPSSFSSDLTNERAGRSLHLKNGCRCDGKGQRVALGGPLGQAGSPSPLSRRRHWPLPLVGRYLGHNPLPPAPPKGDWPVEADQARLTLPAQPRISTSDHLTTLFLRIHAGDYGAWG